MFIEQAFGMLKNRWRILKHVCVFYEHTTDVVDACVALHNYCIFATDVWPKPTPKAPRGSENEADRDTFSKIRKKCARTHTHRTHKHGLMCAMRSCVRYGHPRLPEWVELMPDVGALESAGS